MGRGAGPEKAACAGFSFNRRFRSCLQYKNLIFDGEKYGLPERTGAAPDCEGTGHTGIANEISRQNIFQGQSVSKCLEYREYLNEDNTLNVRYQQPAQ